MAHEKVEHPLAQGSFEGKCSSTYSIEGKRSRHRQSLVKSTHCLSSSSSVPTRLDRRSTSPVTADRVRLKERNCQYTFRVTEASRATCRPPSTRSPRETSLQLSPSPREVHGWQGKTLEHLIFRLAHSVQLRTGLFEARDDVDSALFLDRAGPAADDVLPPKSSHSIDKVSEPLQAERSEGKTKREGERAAPHFTSQLFRPASKCMHASSECSTIRLQTTPRTLGHS